MGTLRRSRWLALLVALPMAVLVMLRTVPTLDRRFFDSQMHLVVVGGIAACALVTAFVASVAAARSSQPGAVWLGIGCTAVGVFMLGHGVMTPGQFGRGYSEWVVRFPHLAMAMFAVALVAASRPAANPLNVKVGRSPGVAMATGVAPMVALFVAVQFDPHLFAGSAATVIEENVFDLVSTATLVLLATAMWIHWRRWQLARDVLQLAIVVAAAMSVAAVMAFQHGRFQQISWWDYHAYLLAGFGAAVWAVFQRGRSERRISDVLTHAFSENPLELIEQGYPEALRTLVRAVEVKDAYTHGHSERTARLAVEIGIAMRLAPDQLRVIARGGYLHDLGKIGIPDHILNKPGTLTPEERAIIETHPELGFEMARAAPSLAEVLPVILHHHERVDGAGYPHQLAGEQIPIEARVVAVADVWDALTSDRAYRKGWAPADALAHIEAGAGTHFDVRAVAALTTLAVGWGVRSAGDGRAEEAWSAAQTCHEIDGAQLEPV